MEINVVFFVFILHSYNNLVSKKEIGPVDGTIKILYCNLIIHKVRSVINILTQLKCTNMYLHTILILITIRTYFWNIDCFHIFVAK